MSTLLTETGLKLFGRFELQPSHTATPFIEQAQQWPTTLWEAIVEAGMPYAMLAEKHGGFGFEETEIFDLLALAARYDTPVPLGETLLANWLFAQAGLPLTEKPCAIVSGLTFSKASNPHRISGRSVRVPFGRHLSCIAALANSDDGSPYLIQINNKVSCETLSHNLSGEARDTVVFDIPIESASIKPLPITAKMLYSRCALLRASAMSGAMEAALERCVSYANERKQFGRPIGKFQAIQHYLATMASEVAAVRMAVTSASRLWNQGDQFLLASAAAKVRAGEAAGIVIKHAHQIHGAIGFSWEYALHPLTRKLWAWREEYGNETYWSEYIGEYLIEQGPNSLWPNLTYTAEAMQ